MRKSLLQRVAASDARGRGRGAGSGGAPPAAPVRAREEEDKDGIAPLVGQGAYAAPPRRAGSRDFGQASWNDHFERVEDVRVPGTGNVFRVHLAGNEGPAIVLLHGAGHTSLSWALVAGRMRASCRVVAMDFRGHGGSTCSDDTDLSANTLLSDVNSVLLQLFGGAAAAAAAAAAAGSAAPPLPAATAAVAPCESVPIVLCGHSMGGAIAARVAAAFPPSLTLAGLIVIDVVEGTAMAALQHMHRVLAQRPSRFGRIEDAIEWSVRSGMVRNLQSAKISVPPQLKLLCGGEGCAGTGAGGRAAAFGWKTDLAASEVHWRGWFEGLSPLFLAVPAPKMLMLAGSDRLDTPLTVAQMQGKFQLKLLYGCGHTVQEDNPTETADAILHFAARLGLLVQVGAQSEQAKLQEKLARAKALKPRVG